MDVQFLSDSAVLALQWFAFHFLVGYQAHDDQLAYLGSFDLGNRIGVILELCLGMGTMKWGTLVKNN